MISRSFFGGVLWWTRRVYLRTLLNNVSERQTILRGTLQKNLSAVILHPFIIPRLVTFWAWLSTTFWTLYVCDRESKQQRLNENVSSVVWGLVDLRAAKCSCMLSAVGHLGYCRFQQKMMKARASSGGRWGLGGHSLAVPSWPESKWLSVAVILYFFDPLSSRLHSVTAALHILNYSWSALCTNVYLCTHTPTIIHSFVGGKGAQLRLTPSISAS